MPPFLGTAHLRIALGPSSPEAPSTLPAACGSSPLLLPGSCSAGRPGSCPPRRQSSACDDMQQTSVCRRCRMQCYVTIQSQTIANLVDRRLHTILKMQTEHVCAGVWWGLGVCERCLCSINWRVGKSPSACRPHQMWSADRCSEGRYEHNASGQLRQSMARCDLIFSTAPPSVGLRTCADPPWISE